MYSYITVFAFLVTFCKRLYCSRADSRTKTDAGDLARFFLGKRETHLETKLSETPTKCSQDLVGLSYPDKEKHQTLPPKM